MKNGSMLPCDLEIQPIYSSADILEEYIAILIDTSAKKASEKALQDYAEELQRYAYVASHDLQEPLRKIETYADFMQQAILENNHEDVDRAVNVITQAVRRGRHMVTDLLRYSKLKDRELIKLHFILKILLKI
jgi:light-regulated signal transduction histidine kinase (bacteriophytochrome)